jgi:hypothetical protein
MSFISPFTGDVIQPTDVSFRRFTMAANTTLSWPINGNVTGDYAARIMEVQATPVGLSLFMPPANQTSVGTDALIFNYGSNAFTVKDSSGGTIITINAGEAQYIYVTTNANAAGTWGVIAFGAGSSGGNASSLAGLGLLAVASTLNQSHPVSAIASGYTFVSGDRAQLKVWSGGAGSITLPIANSLGNNWFTLLKNNGSGTLSISTSGSQLIDGQLNKQYNPGEASLIICTGTEYLTVGFGINANFGFNVLVKSVTGGAVALTASEASNIVQEYVGNLTANVTVTYPPIVQLYIISNQTVDNGFNLVITTGTVGASSVTVPPGQQVTVFCDGTNFLNANTVQVGASFFQLLDGNLSTPSISYVNEPNTGMYRPGGGQNGFSILGALVMLINSSGIVVTGTGTFSGGISGGTFP